MLTQRGKTKRSSHRFSTVVSSCDTPLTISPATDWLAFEKHGNEFHLDDRLVRTFDGEVLTGVNFFRTCRILSTLGLRNLTDTEYNIAVDEGVEIAEQMRSYLVRTGLLINVVKAEHGFRASYVASPQVRKTCEGLQVTGFLTQVTLPEQGWFKVDELLRSETGLPETTYENVPGGRYAYFWIQEGVEKYVIRGGWSWSPNENRCFDVHASWDRSYSSTDIAMLAASSPKPDSLLSALAGLW